MLIPSIDLMNGRIVQLIQGEKKALEFENFSPWIERFSKFPLVQLIDLDAAMGNGSNRELVKNFCGQLPCQVGGGMRTTDDVRCALQSGARRVIVGSSLVKDNAINANFASSLAESFATEQMVFAIDSRGGRVAIHGWKTLTEIRPAQMMSALESFCSAFLYTHIDSEGLLKGIPLDVVRELRSKTARQLIVAGGIRSREEIDALDAIGVDAVVGMAIYSGIIDL